MVDRLLRVHIKSQRAFGPWWTLRYNMVSVIVAGSVCVHESSGTWLWPMLCLIGVSQRQ